MKKIIFLLSVMAGVLFMGKAEAQINLSINIGSQPAWGPTGYNHVDYYYLPDINSYYNVATAQYIYLQGNKWRFAKKLPNRYRNFNVYNAYKVVVNRPTPYKNNRYDVQQYGHYKGYKAQPMLRDNKRYIAMRHNGQGNHGHNKVVIQHKDVRAPRNVTPVRRAVVRSVR